MLCLQNANKSECLLLSLLSCFVFKQGTTSLSCRHGETRAYASVCVCVCGWQWQPRSLLLNAYWRLLVPPASVHYNNGDDDDEASVTLATQTKRFLQLPLRSEWLWLSVAQWPHDRCRCSSDSSIGGGGGATLNSVTSHFNKTFFFLCWFACFFSSLTSLFYADVVAQYTKMVKIQKKVEFIQYCCVTLMWMGLGRMTRRRIPDRVSADRRLLYSSARLLPPPRPSVLLQRQRRCTVPVLDDNEGTLLSLPPTTCN